MSWHKKRNSRQVKISRKLNLFETILAYMAGVRVEAAAIFDMLALLQASL